MTKPTKQILQEARDYLAAHPERWVQKELGDGYNVCAVGSIARAAGWWAETIMDYMDYEAYGAGVASLKEALPICWNGDVSVPSYNDAPGRTVDDVLALFDYAIKGERMPSPEDRRED